MGNRIELKINGVDVDDTTPTGAEIVKWAERDKIAKEGKTEKITVEYYGKKYNIQGR